MGVYLLPQPKYTLPTNISMTNNNTQELLETKLDGLCLNLADIETREVMMNQKIDQLTKRIAQLEKFISERLDRLVENKIQQTEEYLEDKIDELSTNLDSQIEDVRSDIPDTYDLESSIEDVENDISSLDSRVDEHDRRLADLEG